MPPKMTSIQQDFLDKIIMRSLEVAFIPKVKRVMYNNPATIHLKSY